MDYGDIMMKLHRKKEEQAKAEQLKNEVKLLKRRHDATLDRERRVREDINAGTVGPLSSYRLPLSVLPSTSPAPPPPTAEELARLRSAAAARQRLEGLALATGVTCWLGEHGETIVYFDPYVGGRHYGPYELRLKLPKEGKMVLKGHSLPHEVPTLELYKRALEEEGEVRPLLHTLATHLRAALSRQQQVEELKERFPEEVKEVSCTNKGTGLTVVLGLVDQETAVSHEITVTMVYERAAERPSSLVLDFHTSEGEGLTEEEERAVRKECRAFYTKRLAAAVAAAFNA